MIRVRKGGERAPGGQRRREIWNSFLGGGSDDPLAGGLGSLMFLREERLPPGARSPPVRHAAAELITFVRAGKLMYCNDGGHAGVMIGGEFQRRDVAAGHWRNEFNASKTHWTSVFHFGLRAPRDGLKQSLDRARYSAAHRRDQLCLVASQDGRKGSLQLQADASLYSAILQAGHHVVHEIESGRRAYLHVVQGTVNANGCTLTTGDGAHLCAERVLSITAGDLSEVLLIDLNADA